MVVVVMCWGYVQAACALSLFLQQSGGRFQERVLKCLVDQIENLPFTEPPSAYDASVTPVLCLRSSVINCESLPACLEIC